MNRYYIINLPFENIEELYSIIVGLPESQRLNNNSTKMVIKLKTGDESIYSILEGIEEFNYSQILIELQNLEWN